jgi:hypothetical protein
LNVFHADIAKKIDVKEHEDPGGGENNGSLQGENVENSSENTNNDTNHSEKQNPNSQKTVPQKEVMQQKIAEESLLEKCSSQSTFNEPVKNDSNLRLNKTQDKGIENKLHHAEDTEKIARTEESSGFLETEQKKAADGQEPIQDTSVQNKDFESLEDRKKQNDELLADGKGLPKTDTKHDSTETVMERKMKHGIKDSKENDVHSNAKDEQDRRSDLTKSENLNGNDLSKQASSFADKVNNNANDNGGKETAQGGQDIASTEECTKEKKDSENQQKSCKDVHVQRDGKTEKQKTAEPEVCILFLWKEK